MANEGSNELIPKPEQSRIAAQQFERARQAITSGNHDYSIELLQTCCLLDPGNLIYRKALRRTQKAKYNNNLRGSMFAWLTTMFPKARMKRAARAGNYLKVLELGEIILSANPWATGTQIEMAHAAECLGLIDVGVWILEQARQKNPRDMRVNRTLAELYEKQGNFAQAIAMWDMVNKANPHDLEAGRKAKDLAATHTIVKGQYEQAVQGGERLTPARELQLPPETEDSDTGPLGRRTEPLRRKIAADPGNPNLYLQLATIYQRAGELDKANQTLEQGLSATGRNFELQIAATELEIEPFRQNLRLVEEKLQAHPQDQKLLHLQSHLEKEIINREMATIRQKADRFPSELGHRLELGIRLLHLGQTDEAIQELQNARKDPRHRWRALLHLGHCFRARKNWILARRNYTEALEGLPASEEEARKELMLHLAQIAAEEKDWRTAVELGTELANLDFAYHDIGRLLDRWQAEMEKSQVGG